MSQDYHQGIFNFSNGFERSHQDQQQQQQEQQHVAQQIRRDKLRVQGFVPPPLVGMEEDEEPSGGSGLPVNYETAGMLSEMFNFPSGGGATELLESQILQSYRHPRPSSSDWFHRQGMAAAVVGGDLGVLKNQHHHHHHHHQQQQIQSMNTDSAAAMQLFLMNPHQQQQQQRSPSPSTSNPPPPQSTSSTLHMLMPNPSGGAFGQFTYENSNNPNDIPGVVEGQGLSLSLQSSSLEAAKAEELRMGEGNMLFFGGGGSTPVGYQFKNLGGGLQLHGGHMGMGPTSSSSYGAVGMLRNSKYAKAAQELLEEFCSVGRGQFKKNVKFRRQNNDNGNPSSADGGNSSSASKDGNNNQPLSAADRLEHQRRKVKLLSMLDENEKFAGNGKFRQVSEKHILSFQVDRRYNHYCEQMQMVVNSFDMVMGFGAAAPYTCLAQKAMSRHFRCLKDAVAGQLRHSCSVLGEKDAGSSGVTKGETPRLRMLEQSLRQQRAFHQMGMMEQEAWRPQRGLPERSVNILRAWLFEHFLHPYPSDADKHLLARQTGLSRNQVSNWFINARVRLWKPMVEDMYQQEAKDEEVSAAPDEDDNDQQRDQNSTHHHHNSAPADAPIAAAPTPPAARRSNREADPFAMNTQFLVSDSSMADVAVGHSFPAMHEPGDHNDEDGVHDGSRLIRFGTSAAGDVSLTLGLRHAGNLPEKGHFSVRDFGGC